MLKRSLRRFVLWSSIPPLAAVYRSIYRAVIWLAVFVLRQYRSILAIYLWRGCAKNDFTPGISDIDLVIVTADDSKEIQSIQKALRTLSTLTAGLIEYYPRLVQTRHELEYRWHTMPMWQYRYQEGRIASKLLYGTDVLSSLPPLTEAQRVSSCYFELNRWWLLFAHELLKTRRHHSDAVVRNVVCYKAVSEVLNIDSAMRTGQYRSHRRESLASSDMRLSRKLEEISDRNFLSSDEKLMDETFSFLLTFFNELSSRFSDRPFLKVLPDMHQAVDCRESELHLGAGTAQHLQVLRKHLEAHWSKKCLNTHVVKSAFWEFEDLLLIIDIDQKMLPTVQEITDLTGLWHQLHNHQIFLFLRLGEVAFPLTPVMPGDLHRGTLTPATVPDVFLQLGAPSVSWTDHTKWYLSDWQSNEQWTHAGQHKKQQLHVIARSAEHRRIVYPLTLPALERETQSLSDSPPARMCTNAVL